MSPRGRRRSPGVPLILDEMHAPVVARSLREKGFDVVAVAEEPELRALTDMELFTWAADHHRRLVTENIKDFRPLLPQGYEGGPPTSGLLFTSSRTFPRTRRNPGPLIEALSTWLAAHDVTDRPVEDWLLPRPTTTQDGQDERRAEK
ncbi:MAG: DUF5615 family PIN-like protein [Mycobacteriales bacterium]